MKTNAESFFSKTNTESFFRNKYILVGLILSFSLQAQTIYVNQENKLEGADGKAWESAYKNLNKALKVAKKGDDIWVAKGEYILKPTRLDGVNVYGGFSATETELAQREVVNNETKLYGRLALQNSLLSSVTVLEEPERHRVVEINFNQKAKNTSFQPNKKRMQDARNKRDRQEKKYRREHPEQSMLKEDKPEIGLDKGADKGQEIIPPQDTNKRKGPPRPEELMQKFDANSDGKISKEEPMKRDWDRLDANHDGFVEEKEIKPPRHQKNGQRPPHGERR